MGYMTRLYVDGVLKAKFHDILVWADLRYNWGIILVFWNFDHSGPQLVHITNCLNFLRIRPQEIGIRTQQEILKLYGICKLHKFSSYTNLPFVREVNFVFIILPMGHYVLAYYSSECFASMLLGKNVD